MKDKTKTSEEDSKTEEEPQKPMDYEFIEPKESTKVNCKLKERLKIYRQNKSSYGMHQGNRNRYNHIDEPSGSNGINQGYRNRYKLIKEEPSNFWEMNDFGL